MSFMAGAAAIEDVAAAARVEREAGQTMQATQKLGVRQPSREMTTSLERPNPATVQRMRGGRARIGPVDAQTRSEIDKLNPDNIPPAVPRRINAFFGTIRPTLGKVASQSEKWMGKNLTKSQKEQVDSVQPDIVRVATTRNPSTVIDELDKATDGMPPALANNVRKRMLKIALGTAGITATTALTLVAAIKKTQTGCYKIQTGSEPELVTTNPPIDFSKDENSIYCACSNDTSNPRVTPDPITLSWCPSVAEGSPNYITCAPFNEPPCTYNEEAGTGFYYSLSKETLSDTIDSITSPDGDDGDDGDLDDNDGDIDGNDGDNDVNSGSNIIKWILAVVCVLMILFFAYQGVIKKDWVYGLGVLIVTVLGVIGAFLI